MNQTLQTLWNKAVENKALLIKLAGVAVGATIGVAVASVIVNAQESMLIEEMTLSVEE